MDNPKPNLKLRKIEQLLSLTAVLFGLSLFLMMPRFGTHADLDQNDVIQESTTVGFTDQKRPTLPYSDPLKGDPIPPRKTTTQRILFTAEKHVEKYRHDMEIFLSIIIAVIVSIILGYALSEIRSETPKQRRLDDEWEAAK